MSKNLKSVFLICIFTSFGLTGCQLTPKAPVVTTTVPATKQFKITGKIGVRAASQNGSAFYGWTQVDDTFAIELTGALGIGQTSIHGQTGNVTLTSSRTGTIQATTPEELLFKATGWQAPITYLIAWIDAQPASAQAEITQDEMGRTQQIHEGGWTATLNYTQQEQLPNKLVIIDDAQQNRVTLTIQTRE